MNYDRLFANDCIYEFRISICVDTFYERDLFGNFVVVGIGNVEFCRTRTVDCENATRQGRRAMRLPQIEVDVVAKYFGQVKLVVGVDTRSISLGADVIFVVHPNGQIFRIDFYCFARVGTTNESESQQREQYNEYCDESNLLHNSS